MAEDKIKRKVVWETSGVSEIIGTILMLSITVVLFSSIITFVGSMPAPRQTFIVDLKCSIQPVNQTEWNQGDVSKGVDFRILHQGGQVMDPLWIQIYITVDNTTLMKKVGEGINDVNGDGKWSVGEYWIYNINTTMPGGVLSLSPTSIFSITIVDQERNTLVWQETLGKKMNVYAPIIKRAWIDSDTATVVDDPGPIGFEKPFRVYAEIVDPEGIGGIDGLNTSKLWVDLSSIGLSTYQLRDVVDYNRDPAKDNIYVAICPGPAKMSVGYYFFKFNASDDSGSAPTVFATKFPVGMVVGEKPQIVVKGDNPNTGKYEYITFSNPEPTNGDTIDITATILNIGGKGANVNVSFYLNTNSSANFIGSTTRLVPEAGQQDAKISWVASPGGVHMIIVEAYVIGETPDFYDPDLSDNRNYTNISVMPKILLVDDDAHVNDLSDGDTTSFMRASLEAADFEYDFTIVGAGDGPQYDKGDYPLVNYDVVIWMTGYRVTKTLTVTPGPMTTARTDDVANLQRYLTNSPTGTVVDGLNGGSLWLISEGFWVEASSNGDLRNFAEDANVGLRVPTIPAPASENFLPAELYGNSTHPVTDYFTDNPIDTIVREGTGKVRSWGFNDIPDKPMIALSNSANTSVYALTYDSDVVTNADTIKDSRILAQSWGFSRIKDTATQAQYAYKAILWLGDINSKFTQDVAISEQTIEPETVFYKQQVTIKFVVRNNGLTNYTTVDNLWYLLRIMDMNGNDMILPYQQRIDFLGTKSNNTLTISYPWIPQEIGYHRISIKIDPYNYIDESNELNNEISSYWGTGELNVLYRVLVVDDDESVNNGGGRYNETHIVTDALDYLGYDYELFTVALGENGPADKDGGGQTALNEYNAVIWVTGTAIGPLTTSLDDPLYNDVANITSYLDGGGNFWLLGNGIWTAGDEAVDSLEQGYLKIDSVDGDQNMATTLWGKENDDVSHGMMYASNANFTDVLTPAPGGIGFTYQDSAMTHFNSVRYKGVTPLNSSIQYRSAVTAWGLSSLTNTLSRAEFVFMMLRWFDKPEDRIEVRIANVDVQISDDHPQLGSGYVIQAQVQNAGGTTGNVLVRFMDGYTQIGSDSISVSANSWTTAEIVWVPLFAGERNIQVLLDPIMEVEEIFGFEQLPIYNSALDLWYSSTGWSNNIATKPTYVYFFWDDMESGPSKWAHSSTIMLINGEGPLEYFGDTAVTVNIEDEWDYGQSVGLENCTDTGFYHTHDTATWMQEPSGSTTVQKQRGPMDVVFALDNSGSMAGTNIANLKSATRNFIGNLTDTDRAAIWIYDNSPNPYLLRAYALMTSVNRASFNASINAITTPGSTPFYDTLGSAIQYTIDNPSTSKAYVIAMTDGESNSDDVYTPNCDWGSTTTSDPEAYADGGDTHPGFTGGHGHGLINPPVMVYTIGLGVGHDPAYPPAPDWSRTSPVTPTYQIEHDIWHCADSSPYPVGSYGYDNTTPPGVPNVGHYYYTNDPNDLGAIFEQIFSSIVIPNLGGEDQTRSGPQQPEPMASGDTLYMRGVVNEVTVNTLTTYSLGLAQSATAQNTGWFGDGGNVYAGIRVYKRSSAGVETQITAAVSAIYLLNWNTAGLFSATWTPPVTALATTDSIVVRVYADITTNPPTTLRGTFTTGQLGATQLSATQWTVWYYLIRSSAGAGNDQWYWGTTTYNSMIEGITYISPTAATATGPIGGPSNVAAVTITYTYSGTPASVNLYYTKSAMAPWTWVLAGNDATVDGSYPYTITAGSGTYRWVAIAVGGGSVEPAIGPAVAPEASSYIFDNVRPTVLSTVPANAVTGVAMATNIVITFSESMNTASFTYTVEPNPGGLAIAWSGVNTIATITHTAFSPNTTYWVNITTALDPAGNLLDPTPYSFYFVTAVLPIAEANGPTGTSNVAAVTITYNWTLTPASVNLYYTTNGGTTWTLAGTDATVDGNYTYTIAAGDGTYGWTATAAGGETTPPTAGSLPEATPYMLDTVKPVSQCVVAGAYWQNAAKIITATASDDRSGVARVTLYYRYALDNATWGVWTSFNSDTAAPWSWSFTFPKGNGFYEFYTIARDVAGNVESAPATADLKHGYITSGGGGLTPGLSPPGANANKSAVTKAMDLTNQDTATLEFWHKYNMVPGANGGVLMIGFFNHTANAWQYKYVVPSSAYTGNLRLNVTGRVDSFGTFIQWGWNGISGRGTFTWEKVNLNILPYLDTIPDDAWLDQVRVKFQYYQYGGGTGYGWYIDDVRVTVSRPNTAPDATSQDVWYRTTAQHHSGNYSWSNVDPDTGFMKGGIDNYLMSSPIDLTNARMAYLSAYVKFNFNYASGAPPDGFRVEISKDNGVTWSAVNLGVRSAWNVSGTDEDHDDGKIDGKSYTGITDSGNAAADGYWVSLGSLTRVNVDLSSFSGNAIQIRFRVVTNSDAAYLHYDTNYVFPDPLDEFGGFYIDDVQVQGETILG